MMMCYMSAVEFHGLLAFIILMGIVVSLLVAIIYDALDD